jgi:hypothetical protein
VRTLLLNADLMALVKMRGDYAKHEIFEKNCRAGGPVIGVYQFQLSAGESPSTPTH